MFIYFHILSSFFPVTLLWVRKVCLQRPSPALFRQLDCSGGAEYCLELETDACHGDSKELPGFARGPGELWEMLSVTLFPVPELANYVTFWGGRTKDRLLFFLFRQQKRKEMKLQLTQDYRETFFIQVIISASGIINLAEIIQGHSLFFIL